MQINTLSEISEKPARADESAMCTINRHLQMSGLSCDSALMDATNLIFDTLQEPR